MREISTILLQLKKEGYPNRVCDYCQLQLNTFHAFVRKAKNTSTQLETMLKQLKRDGESVQAQIETDGEAEPERELQQKHQTTSTNNTLMPADDEVEYEMELAQDDESMEFIVNKGEIKLVVDDSIELVHLDENEIEGLDWNPHVPFRI